MLLLDHFNCLKCRKNIDHEVFEDSIICNNCGKKYPVVKGVPIFILEENSVFKNKDFTDEKSLFFNLSKEGVFIRNLSKLIPTNSHNWTAKRNFAYLDRLLNTNTNTKTLVIGGSVTGKGFKHFLKDNSDSIIVESDVSYGPRTKIIFDCHDIPYKDETFDCVIIQAVLEHVVDPNRCVSEIFRVLKSEGYIYAETPFMQQVHGGPYDFTRFTHSGHRLLFKNFEELSSGSTAGAGSVMLWSYEYLLVSVFGFNSFIRLLLKAFARLTGFFLPFLDFLTTWNTRSKDGALGLYFIGKKTERKLKIREIIEYYNQKK